MELGNRSALVTGANRGIGLHTVHALLDAGVAKVYAGARDTASLKPLVKQYGSKVVPVQLDVTRTKDVNAAAKLAKDVTILVNNAGVATMGSLFAKGALKNLKHEWDINVVGMLNMSRAFAPILEKNAASSGGDGGAAIVNLNSVVSLKSFPFSPTYCASKAAAFSFTQALRNELDAKGVLVVSVFPGPIDTDMAKDIDLEKVGPRQVGDEIVRALREEHAFLFPDPMSLNFWHQLTAAPGPFLASVSAGE